MLYLKRLLAPFREQTDILQTDTLSLSSVIPSLLELSLHLQDDTLPALYSNQLLQALRLRFANLLDPCSPSFDPLPAAACLLDPTVASVMMRDDMSPVLTAAKNWIKLQVSLPMSTTRYCEILHDMHFIFMHSCMVLKYFYIIKIL
jgi:hypothetical protein